MSYKQRLNKNFPSVAVATVTMNRSKPLMRLLKLVRELNYPQENIDIFICDNASEDETVELIRNRYPETEIIESTKNVGISAGFNLAIKKALDDARNYDYIWLLDDDAELEKETLRPLIAAAEDDPNIAAVGSVVYDIDNPDHRVTVGLNINWDGASFRFHRPADNNQEKIYNVDVVAACSALTRASVYKKLGLWDESFWLYWGDTDWCARAKKHGFRICCQTESRVWHRNWASVQSDFHQPIVFYDHIRGGLLFYLRYHPKRSLKSVKRLIFKSYLKAALESITQRPNYNRGCNEGVEDFIKGHYNRKDFSSWSSHPVVDEFDKVCMHLKSKISNRPQILINQIDTPIKIGTIKKGLEKYLEKVHWDEITVQPSVKKDHLSVHYFEYIFYYIPRFIASMFKGRQKSDLIISHISNPELINCLLARYTLFINNSYRACLVKNDFKQIFPMAFGFLLKGFQTAFVNLSDQMNKQVLNKLEQTSLKQTSIVASTPHDLENADVFQERKTANA